MTRDRLDRKEKPGTSENRPETMQLPVKPGQLGKPGTQQLDLGVPGSPRSCSRPHRNLTSQEEQLARKGSLQGTAPRRTANSRRNRPENR